jgi:hypothetical protein
VHDHPCRRLAVQPRLKTPKKEISILIGLGENRPYRIVVARSSVRLLGGRNSGMLQPHRIASGASWDNLARDFNPERGRGKEDPASRAASGCIPLR